MTTLMIDLIMGTDYLIAAILAGYEVKEAENPLEQGYAYIVEKKENGEKVYHQVYYFDPVSPYTVYYARKYLGIIIDKK